MSHTQVSLDQIIENAVQNGSTESMRGYRGSALLLRAVRSNKTKLVRVLLKHGANPNYNRQRPGRENFGQWRQSPRHTDRAIDHGNIDMLAALLEADAHVGDCNTKIGTSLNNLLLYPYKSRETKLIICRMLAEHANKETNNDDIDNNNNGTSIFLQTTLEQAFVLNGKQGYEILLEAGVEPRGTTLLYRAIKNNTVDICQLLLHYGANPFLEEGPVEEQQQQQQQPSGQGVKKSSTTLAPPSSPFHAAARLTDTTFLELFLKHWDCNKCGRDDDNDGEYYYPIQIIYRDDDSSHHHDVSLEAVKVIVAHACHTDALMKAHGEHGLVPLHSAAMRNARLDVIFLLLNYWPSALLGHQQQQQQLPSSP